MTDDDLDEDTGIEVRVMDAEHWRLQTLWGGHEVFTTEAAFRARQEWHMERRHEMASEHHRAVIVT